MNLSVTFFTESKIQKLLKLLKHEVFKIDCIINELYMNMNIKSNIIKLNKMIQDYKNNKTKGDMTLFRGFV